MTTLLVASFSYVEVVCICVTFFTPPTCIMHIDQMQMQIVAVRKMPMAWSIFLCIIGVGI